MAQGDSKFFDAVLEEFRKAQLTPDEFLDATGYSIAGTKTGRISGRSADVIIIDDPITENAYRGRIQQAIKLLRKLSEEIERLDVQHSRSTEDFFWPKFPVRRTKTQRAVDRIMKRFGYVPDGV